MLNTALYFPPNVEDMETAMSDLEKFIKEEDELDPLLNYPHLNSKAILKWEIPKNSDLMVALLLGYPRSPCG